MSEERSMEARNKAGQYFKDGHNCAEAIFLAFKDEFDLDENLVKMFTGFGRGVGEAGCMCGALTGCIGVLSMITGRTTTDNEERDQCYAYTKEFHDRFKEQFSITCCRALNPYDFSTRDHAVCCLKITGKTGKLFMEFLQEKGLVK
ncbi:MAG: C-GCAxxG-C-C family protein [Clostridia bacterium]|nr:C-GCAxxG-C-C family protein [Clostridia bacterium]